MILCIYHKYPTYISNICRAVTQHIYYICSTYMLGDVTYMLSNMTYMLGSDLWMMFPNIYSTILNIYTQHITQHIPNIYRSWYPTYIMYPTCIIMLPNIYTKYFTIHVVQHIWRDICWGTFRGPYICWISLYICWRTCDPTYIHVAQHIYGARNVPQHICPTYIPNTYMSVYMLWGSLICVGDICLVTSIYVGSHFREISIYMLGIYVG